MNIEESQDMPSLNHSLLQARLVRLTDERYVPLTELSLDVSSLLEEMLSTEVKNCLLKFWTSICPCQKFLQSVEMVIDAQT
jgi:hypothetical protein